MATFCLRATSIFSSLALRAVRTPSAAPLAKLNAASSLRAAAAPLSFCMETRAFASEAPERLANLSLVARPAPDFTADAAMPGGEIAKLTLSELCGNGSGVVLLFYPLDFTFVCPSEILAFNAAVADFEKLGFKVVGVSVDSVFTHQAWMRVPLAEGGIGKLDFPLVSDLDKTISSRYHSLLNNSVALRTLVIIDGAKNVRHMTVNDLPLGRNVEEALRVCEMIREVEKNGGKQVCPANWRRGEKMMEASFHGVKDYLGGLREKIEKQI
ncbi:peroxiredoxin PRX3 [Besnoitia besnoiti]|uniref:Peroxiredoxin PRX3 n=1 Tax=Besnoitia besnoiti TaxID=94643 RepID=A0A2A9MMW8_BESBE|nr:peroxiredoxin PRX3 [Besnoitia besnoiti]PFH38734.1 peroxiredoxin PRX3 [Besnoitia besnoiti]